MSGSFTPAYVPGFGYDFFVSYAHVDNPPLRKNEKGWVANFNCSFRLFLARELGRQEIFSGWFDDELRGNTDFDDEIKDALQKSAILIFVHSQGYVSSKWCRRELNDFCQADHPGFDLKVGNQFRLFRVEIGSVAEIPDSTDYHPIPDITKEMTGYRFYETVKDADMLYRRADESDPDQRYWGEMQRLARHVADLLRQMKKRAKPAPEPLPGDKTGPVVYLADTTDDLDEEHVKLKTALKSLKDKGVRVVPEFHLNVSDPNLTQTIREMLSQATIAIHLIGKFPGRRPVNETRSIVHLQRDLALETAKGKKLDRLFWLSPELDLATVSEGHRQFIGSLEEAPGDAPEAEMRRCGIEELKEIILSRIFPPLPHLARADDGANHAADDQEEKDRLVYLPYLPCDKNGAIQLKKVLREKKLDVRLLAYDDRDLEKLKPHHESALNVSDGVLIYYGVDALWAEERALETRGIARARKNKRPLKAVGICDGPPESMKGDLGVDFEGLIVADCRDSIDPDDLNIFVEAIKR